VTGWAEAYTLQVEYTHLEYPWSHCCFGGQHLLRQAVHAILGAICESKAGEVRLVWLDAGV